MSLVTVFIAWGAPVLDQTRPRPQLNQEKLLELKIGYGGKISLAVITVFDPWGSPLCTCPKKYSLSAYTGCGHACRYCYISAYIPDAFRGRVKEGFITRLQRDLGRINPGLHVSMANSSDPYNPLEAEFQLTRRALQILLSRGFRVQLITKSDLLLRDLDLIRRGNCSVSMSITTLDEGVAKRLEPNAPSPSERLKAIQRLVREGVPCSIRMDPIIPGITDHGLEGLVKLIAESGVSHIVASTYKAKRDSFHRVITAFPELEEKLTQLYWIDGEHVGRAQYLPKKFREGILTSLKDVVERDGMTYATCREGIPRLQSARTCDGSHLIPNRLKAHSQRSTLLVSDEGPV